MTLCHENICSHSTSSADSKKRGTKIALRTRNLCVGVTQFVRISHLHMTSAVCLSFTEHLPFHRILSDLIHVGLTIIRNSYFLFLVYFNISLHLFLEFKDKYFVNKQNSTN